MLKLKSLYWGSNPCGTTKNVYMTKEQKEQIHLLNNAKEKMMKDFDFIKVCGYIAKHHWIWYNFNGVPLIWEIETTAKGLMEEVIALLQKHRFKYDEYLAGTGGFCAFIKWRDNIKSIRLMFGKSDSKPLLAKTISIYRKKRTRGFIL